MITTWIEVLPKALASLTPRQQDILMYILSLPGKRRLSYRFALEKWNLSRPEYDAELRYAFDGIRLYLLQYGLTSSDDLELE